MDGETNHSISYTEWSERVIGLISGPEFDGEREVRVKATVSSNVLDQCYIGPAANPEGIRGELLLSMDASDIAERLLKDMQQRLPAHSIRAHSAPQPFDLRPFPDGPGDYGVSLPEGHKERMLAQSGPSSPWQSRGATV